MEKSSDASAAAEEKKVDPVPVEDAAEGGTAAKTAKAETPSENVADFHPDRLVPQLAGHGITEADLRTAAKVLEAVAELNPQRKKRCSRCPGGESDPDKPEKHGGLEEYQKPNLRTLRKGLAQCFELHKQVVYGGKTENEHYADQTATRTLKRQKTAERDQQKKYIAKTQLRRGRVEKLEKLKQEARDEELEKMRVMIPDGHVDTESVAGTGAGLMLEDSKKSTEEGSDPSIRLPKLRSCYVCKVRFRELHQFYDQLCPTCAPLNFDKRHQSADLRGKVAVVTGSRVKIGYQVCLKLLRAGARVVATTRFPNSAAAVYRSEPDFADWSERLHVYGLDLRDVTGLEAFTRFLKVRYGDQGIDILINNACQTVRRPRGYYTPLVDREQKLWNESDNAHKGLLGGCIEFERLRRKLVLDHSKGGEKGGVTGELENGSDNDVHLLKMAMGGGCAQNDDNADSIAASSGAKPSAHSGAITTSSSSVAISPEEDKAPFEATGVSHSAAMSQMVILPEDVGISPSILPPGVSDINGQQLDLRQTNSWLLKMDEVSTPEVLECMVVNAIAPFVLNSRLKPLMTTPAGSDRPDRYIINVSAMEGKFYRYKMPNHPHTNMAKAALNMLTRTSSEDLAKKHRIYMNSVDTGWINDENPLEKASKIAKTNLFQTPIDEIDAAARILDPVFTGVSADHEKGGEKSKDYGKFFKDYRETEW